MLGICSMSQKFSGNAAGLQVVKRNNFYISSILLLLLALLRLSIKVLQVLTKLAQVSMWYLSVSKRLTIMTQHFSTNIFSLYNFLQYWMSIYKHCIFRMPVRSTSQCLNVLPWSTAVRPTWPRPCPVSTSTIGVLILGHSEDMRSIISKLVTHWQGARKYYHCYFFVR